MKTNLVFTGLNDKEENELVYKGDDTYINLLTNEIVDNIDISMLVPLRNFIKLHRNEFKFIIVNKYKQFINKILDLDKIYMGCIYEFTHTDIINYPYIHYEGKVTSDRIYLFYLENDTFYDFFTGKKYYDIDSYKLKMVPGENFIKRERLKKLSEIYDIKYISRKEFIKEYINQTDLKIINKELKKIINYEKQ